MLSINIFSYSLDLSVSVSTFYSVAMTLHILVHSISYQLIFSLDQRLSEDCTEQMTILIEESIKDFKQDPELAKNCKVEVG